MISSTIGRFVLDCDGLVFDLDLDLELNLYDEEAGSSRIRVMPFKAET